MGLDGAHKVGAQEHFLSALEIECGRCRAPARLRWRWFCQHCCCL